MLILGSQSPRRKEILSYFSIPFRQETSHFDEDAIPFNGKPIEYALQLAQGKANSLGEKFPNDLILTADTIVYRDGEIFGKPSDEEHAFQIISKLAGHWHCVYTALVLCQKGQFFHTVEKTGVLFNHLTDEQVRSYCQKTHVYDKAGGYAIQGAGGLIVKRIDGCYYNVMGLPINGLWHLLQQVGINLWDYLK